MVYMKENFILLGFNMAFDVTLNFTYRGPLYKNLENRGVYKVPTKSARLLQISAF